VDDHESRKYTVAKAKRNNSFIGDWSGYLKLLIKGDKRTRSRVYNKIFNICDKYTTFFKTETDSEYETVDGYAVEFDCPPDAEFEISELKNVDVI
jgi:hypothetical protein